MFISWAHRRIWNYPLFSADGEIYSKSNQVVSIPRLELTSALLSIKMSKLVKKELDIKDYEETCWTDSKAILGYINKEVKRFKIFVGKRKYGTMQIHPIKR